MENGELVNDGKGVYCTTDRDYENFELHLDWKMVEPNTDSGIYLRGTPQVQIWDPANPKEVENGAPQGSGGLWNNNQGTAGRFPTSKQDRPIGEWNQFRIRMVDDVVTVYFNGERVVDQAVMTNFWARDEKMFPSGPIQLQTHGGEMRFRNVFLRELEPTDANASADQDLEEGFALLHEGDSAAGWTDQVMAQDGILRGRGWYSERKFGDFHLKFEFRLEEGANSGIGIRSSINKNPAYHGMEIQVLDNTAERYNNLKDWQYHGSIYGVAAAQRGCLNDVGEWNQQEIIANGNQVTVIVNGHTIVDVNLQEVAGDGTIDGGKHPGLFNRDGYLAILGHGAEDHVEFRRMRVKELTPGSN